MSLTISKCILIVLVMLGSAERAIASTIDDRPPNIILIVSDDQGYNDLGVLNPQVHSPALDRLAREGVRFTSFYVAWPACTPSRGALLTGRYPQRNGIYDMIRNEAPDYGYEYPPAEYEVTFERIGGMDVREVLISNVLQEAGYQCGIFGKWDLGSLNRFLPQQRGFDRFYGFVNTGIDYFTHERYGVPSMYDGNELTIADRGTYCTDLFRREAVRFLEAHRDGPFFLYLPFNAPHNASNLDPAIRGAAQAPEDFKALFPDLDNSLRLVERNGEELMLPTAERRRLEYLASIASMDAAIGEILELLDEWEIAENTLVIFLSDNGGSGGADNSPLRGHKSQMYEGGIRVCAMARWPGVIPAGSVNEEFLTTLEVFPTLAAVAGASMPEGVILDGFDLLPTARGDSPSSRTEMFWQRRDHSAARVGDWKWIRIGETELLFNLSVDPGESTDLADVHLEKLDTLRSAFAAWEQELQASEPRGPFRDY